MDFTVFACCAVVIVFVGVAAVIVAFVARLRFERDVRIAEIQARPRRRGAKATVYTMGKGSEALAKELEAAGVDGKAERCG